MQAHEGYKAVCAYSPDTPLLSDQKESLYRSDVALVLGRGGIRPRFRLWESGSDEAGTYMQFLVLRVYLGG